MAQYRIHIEAEGQHVLARFRRTRDAALRAAYALMYDRIAMDGRLDTRGAHDRVAEFDAIQADWNSVPKGPRWPRAEIALFHGESIVIACIDKPKRR